MAWSKYKVLGRKEKAEYFKSKNMLSKNNPSDPFTFTLLTVKDKIIKMIAEAFRFKANEYEKMFSDIAEEDMIELDVEDTENIQNLSNTYEEEYSIDSLDNELAERKVTVQEVFKHYED